MGNLGMPEMVLIFSIALLVFGPRKLPELGQAAGKSIRDFKRALAGQPEQVETIAPPEKQETMEKI